MDKSDQFPPKLWPQVLQLLNKYPFTWMAAGSLGSPCVVLKGIPGAGMAPPKQILRKSGVSLIGGTTTRGLNGPMNTYPEQCLLLIIITHPRTTLARPRPRVKAAMPSSRNSCRAQEISASRNTRSRFYHPNRSLPNFINCKQVTISGLPRHIGFCL